MSLLRVQYTKAQMLFAYGLLTILVSQHENQFMEKLLAPNTVITSFQSKAKRAKSIFGLMPLFIYKEDEKKNTKNHTSMPIILWLHNKPINVT